jgi:sterol desaturase/sphingolipid hydroxylase (fatty acid hydroxylase superfamily)
VFGNAQALFAFRKEKHTLRQILTNLLFIVPAGLVQIAIGAIVVEAIRFTGQHHIGLLQNLPFTPSDLGMFLLSFILFDFFEYIYHVTMHKVKRLWMAHLVHHSDRELTVFTTLREHPLETFVRLLFLVLWILLSGISFWALLARQFIQIVSNVWVHANLRLTNRVDAVVSMAIVTPNMHQAHHHFQQPLTDRNYGDVLSIWDRLFGTFAVAKGQELVFGVDTYFDKKENGMFLNLLKIPFGAYRKPGSK